MNKKIIKLQTALGAINLFVAAIGIGITVAMFVLSSGGDYYSHYLGLAITRLFVMAAIIWFSILLFPSKEKEEEKNAGKKGWVIFFLTWSCVGLLLYNWTYVILTDAYGFYFLLPYLVYIASLVISAVTLRQYAKVEDEKKREFFKNVPFPQGNPPSYPADPKRMPPPNGYNGNPSERPSYYGRPPMPPPGWGQPQRGNQPPVQGQPQWNSPSYQGYPRRMPPPNGYNGYPPARPPYYGRPPMPPSGWGQPQQGNRSPAHPVQEQRPQDNQPTTPIHGQPLQGNRPQTPVSTPRAPEDVKGNDGAEKTEK